MKKVVFLLLLACAASIAFLLRDTFSGTGKTFGEKTSSGNTGSETVRIVDPAGEKTAPAQEISQDPQRDQSRQAVRWHEGNLVRHWAKHSQEFPECRNAQEYGENAVLLITRPPPDLQKKTDKNGDRLYYSPSRNIFIAVTKDGFIKTCFKPDRGINYWKRQ